MEYKEDVWLVWADIVFDDYAYHGHKYSNDSWESGCSNDLTMPDGLR
jgi:hypothetical protein